MTEPAPRTSGRRRGSVAAYTAAFTLMLVGAAILVAASLGSLRSMSLLWASVVFSAAASALAVVSLLVPRR